MTALLIPVETIPRINHEEAGGLALTENSRFLELLRTLDPDDWNSPTDCPAWDVRALCSHVLGAMESQASFPVFVHQFRAGTKAAAGRPLETGISEVQVRERAHLSPAEIVACMAHMAPVAARRRTSLPSLPGRFRIKVDVAGAMEPWTLRYFFDTVLTRDTWMHRIDVSRATNRPLVTTAEHDGRIVADVVAEWAGRHRQPFTLHLDGVAGGTFTAGSGGEEIAMDAIEFCRVLSGRGPATGLLNQVVPF